MLMNLLARGMKGVGLTAALAAAVLVLLAEALALVATAMLAQAMSIEQAGLRKYNRDAGGNVIVLPRPRIPAWLKLMVRRLLLYRRQLSPRTRTAKARSEIVPLEPRIGFRSRGSWYPMSSDLPPRHS